MMQVLLNPLRASNAQSLKSATTATMVGGPKEFGGTKAFKPMVHRDVIVSVGPPKVASHVQGKVRQAS